MSLLDMAQTIEIPDHEDLIAAPPRPWTMAPLPASAASPLDETTPPPASRRKRSSSTARKGGKAGASASAPAVAKSLSKALGFSSLLLVTWLDLEDEYAMTADEAKAIAEPAARILIRASQKDTSFGRLVRRLLTFFSTGDGHGDEIALLFALYAYGSRVYPAAAAKLAANAASAPVAPKGGPRGPIPTAQPARSAGPSAGHPGSGSGFPSVAAGVTAFPAD